MPKRNTEKDYHDLCQGRGKWLGVSKPQTTLIDTEWYCFKCEEKFERSYEFIRKNCWHLKCAERTDSVTKDKCRKACEGKGEWVGVKAPLSHEHTDWYCNECKVIFQASYGHVSGGKWHNTCMRKKAGRKNRKYHEKDYHEICSDKGEWRGETLPINIQTETLFWCRKCQKFIFLTYFQVKNGIWCEEDMIEDRKMGLKPRLPLTVLRYKKICEEKGEWVGAGLPEDGGDDTDWYCNECKVIFQASFETIAGGHWHRTCMTKDRDENRRVSEQQYKKVCGEKGEWIGIKRPPLASQLSDWMCFKCKKPFQASFSSIKSGSWCYRCRAFKSEQICRDFFETFFKKTFIKRRPKWLCKLELDGYNEELKIAFEYNGKQHRDLTPFFHRTEEDFWRQQERDMIKKDLCIKNGVKLFVIPDEEDGISYDCYHSDNLKQYMQKEITTYLSSLK